MQYSTDVFDLQNKEAYKALKRESGKVPPVRDLPHVTNLYSKYHNYQNFMDAMGDEMSKTQLNVRTHPLTDQELIAALKDLYDELGYPPHPKDFKRHTLAILHFGNWKKALEAANIQATFAKNSRFSYEEIVFRYVKIKDHLGHVPTWQDLRDNQFPTTAIKKYFGSLKNMTQILRGDSK